MNIPSSVLNLARAWRPKRFSQIVGQDLSVRILKNSLYSGKLFPVYIFAGQRGCGKTSTARIFATALNCTCFDEFQANPQSIEIPCLACSSCKAMQNSAHPDFIEIDAASHTGVDNVRSIIDAAAHLPLSGKKKFYLIDEAHMLSRAAFNAFLKIFEEPPASVYFILATTELHKIPQTVRSRAFHIFFDAVDSSCMHSHLKHICFKEQINIDDEALELISSESEGSVRDSINMLERMRFASKHISKEVALDILGKVSESQLIVFFDVLAGQDAKKALAFLSSISFEKRDPSSLWNMLVELCRALLWIKYGVQEISGPFKQNGVQLKMLANKVSFNRLNAIMQLLWSQEELFLKTAKKHIFLETVVLQICDQTNVADLDALIALCKQGSAESALSNPSLPSDSLSSSKEEVLQRQSTQSDEAWRQFLQKVSSLSDPMLESILHQAQSAGLDASGKKLRIVLADKNRFFEEKLQEQNQKLIACAREFFPEIEEFVFEMRPKGLNKEHVVSKQPEIEGGVHGKQPFSSYVDISDKEKWPKANVLRKYFSGKIEKISCSDKK